MISTLSLFLAESILDIIQRLSPAVYHHDRYCLSPIILGYRCPNIHTTFKLVDPHWHWQASGLSPRLFRHSYYVRFGRRFNSSSSPESNWWRSSLTGLQERNWFSWLTAVPFASGRRVCGIWTQGRPWQGMRLTSGNVSILTGLHYSSYVQNDPLPSSSFFTFFRVWFDTVYLRV